MLCIYDLTLVFLEMESGGVYNALNCNGLISAYSYIKVADIQLVYIVNNFLPRVR